MKFDDVKKLNQKKYRAQFSHYLVEGEHLILELQTAAIIQPEIKDITLYVTQNFEQWASRLTLQCELIVINSKQMSQLSNTKTPQGIVACVPLPRVISAKLPKTQTERSIYLHEVQDPGNLGTILRTLAWFGNFRLLLSENSVDPYNPKVVRASMGAIFHVPIELDINLEKLRSRFDNFAYLDMRGVNINSPQFNQYPCYLFGNEARGVPTESLSACNADAYTIPGSGKIDSLNLASAVNMCAYQLSI
jgi:TrmH family RNA methyltransferase